MGNNNFGLRGCPLLGGSFIGGSTVLLKYIIERACTTIEHLNGIREKGGISGLELDWLFSVLFYSVRLLKIESLAPPKSWLEVLFVIAIQRGRGGTNYRGWEERRDVLEMTYPFFLTGCGICWCGIHYASDNR